MAPDTASDPSALLALAQQATISETGSQEYLITEAAIRYRTGDIDGAIGCLNAAPPVAQVSHKMPIVSPAHAWFYLAMAQHQAGRHHEAQRSWKKAIRRLEEEQNDAQKSEEGYLAWNRTLSLRLLFEETRSRLETVTAQR